MNSTISSAINAGNNVGFFGWAYSAVTENYASTAIYDVYKNTFSSVSDVADGVGKTAEGVSSLGKGLKNTGEGLLYAGKTISHIGESLENTSLGLTSVTAMFSNSLSYMENNPGTTLVIGAAIVISVYAANKFTEFAKEQLKEGNKGKELDIKLKEAETKLEELKDRRVQNEMTRDIISALQQNNKKHEQQMAYLQRQMENMQRAGTPQKNTPPLAPTLLKKNFEIV